MDLFLNSPFNSLCFFFPGINTLLPQLKFLKAVVLSVDRSMTKGFRKKHLCLVGLTCWATLLPSLHMMRKASDSIYLKDIVHFGHGFRACMLICQLLGWNFGHCVGTCHSLIETHAASFGLQMLAYMKIFRHPSQWNQRKLLFLTSLNPVCL